MEEAKSVFAARSPVAPMEAKIFGAKAEGAGNTVYPRRVRWSLRVSWWPATGKNRLPCTLTYTASIMMDVEFHELKRTDSAKWNDSKVMLPSLQAPRSCTVRIVRHDSILGKSKYSHRDARAICGARTMEINLEIYQVYYLPTSPDIEVEKAKDYPWVDRDDCQPGNVDVCQAQTSWLIHMRRLIFSQGLHNAD